MRETALFIIVTDRHMAIGPLQSLLGWPSLNRAQGVSLSLLDGNGRNKRSTGCNSTRHDLRAVAGEFRGGPLLGSPRRIRGLGASRGRSGRRGPALDGFTHMLAIRPQWRPAPA